MTKYIYGIDFGTTNSSLAILEVSTDKIIKVFTTPSLLFFPKVQESRNTFYYSVGNEAVQKYVGSRMQGRFMKSIKKVLPNKSFNKTRIADKIFTAEQLVALVISFLKAQADAYLGMEVTTAVIGRPVVFDKNPEKDALAQSRLSKAAEIAGFKSFYFQLEPIGAAYTYERLMEKDELVLVTDFGGGTSDFTLMRLSPSKIHDSDRQKDMISKDGIYIGGDNFDSRIMWHRGTPNFGRGVKEKIADKWLELPLTYFSNICSWEKMNFLNSVKMLEAIKTSYVFSNRDYRVKNLLTLLEKNLGYAIFRKIEQTKIKLTQSDTAAFKFNQYDIDFEEILSVEEFESEIIPVELQRIEAYLDAFMQKNKLDYSTIDSVFMTGGTSMVRPLRKMIHQKIGADKVKSGDNFNSVAMGLAYSFNVLSK